MTYDDAGSDSERPARHDRQEGCLDRPPDSLPTRVEDLPSLPASFDAVLDDHLDLLGIGLAQGARAGIVEHVRFLIAWNAAINLTAIRDPVDIAVRHVVDSVVGAAVLRSEDVDRFVDLGSGGGFPGIPLAFALPAERVLLVESVGKKARFLQTVLDATGLDRRGAVATERAESLGHEPSERGRWPAVTARAVGALADLIELGFPLLRPGGILVAWKSGDPAAESGLGGEIRAARRALDAMAGARARRRGKDGDTRIEIGPSLVETARTGPRRDAIASSLGGHHLIVVRRGELPVPNEWPRDPVLRRRRPW